MSLCTLEQVQTVVNRLVENVARHHRGPGLRQVHQGGVELTQQPSLVLVLQWQLSQETE